MPLNKWEWINLVCAVLVIFLMIFMAGFWVGESKADDTKSSPPGKSQVLCPTYFQKNVLGYPEIPNSICR